MVKNQIIEIDIAHNMVGNKTTNGTIVSQIRKFLDQNLASLSRKFPELTPEEFLTNFHPLVKHLFTGKIPNLQLERTQIYLAEKIKFVRFAWSGNLYELLFLCFGLVPAPRIFSKLLKVPIALLRQQNILLVISLHNIPLMGRTLEEFLMSQDSFSIWDLS